MIEQFRDLQRALLGSFWNYADARSWTHGRGHAERRRQQSDSEGRFGNGVCNCVSRWPESLARHTAGRPSSESGRVRAPGRPVVSLYLNLAPDQHGRDNYEAFCRKAFADQLSALQEHPAEHASLRRDIDRITAYLANDVTPSANGLAIFSSAGAGDYFVAVQLGVPIDDHWLFISRVPHLYPLVRLIDQYPRYAAVVLDTNQARILVFGLGMIEQREEVKGVKTRRSSMGGWSQARYQRRAENIHLHHVKEVVETLDRVVRDDNVQHVIVLGDQVVVSSLKEALPVHLNDKLIDVGRVDRHASEDDIVAETLDMLRQKDADTDSRESG